MSHERVRLQDVARRAGVSRTTASFVMTGRDEEQRIAAATRLRVLEAAEELGYRPNLAARALRTKSTRTIALVSDSVTTEQYAGEFVRGVLDAAMTHGHLLVIAETEGDAHTEGVLLRGMADRQIDGLVYASLFTKTVAPSVVVDQQPLVLLNCLTQPLRAPAVVPDEVGGGRAAARALLAAGHRDGVHLVGERPRHLFAARERGRGVRAELATAGVRLAGTVDCRWSPPPAHDAVRRLLRRTRPTALICLNDRIAMGAYQALQDAGLSVPGDVSVVSFDDSELARWLRPELTTVALPHHEMGRLATDLLIKGERQPLVHRVAMTIRHRGSVGAPAPRPGPR